MLYCWSSCGLGALPKGPVVKSLCLPWDLNQHTFDNRHRILCHWAPQQILAHYYLIHLSWGQDFLQAISTVWRKDHTQLLSGDRGNGQHKVNSHILLCGHMMTLWIYRAIPRASIHSHCGCGNTHNSSLSANSVPLMFSCVWTLHACLQSISKCDVSKISIFTISYCNSTPTGLRSRAERICWVVLLSCVCFHAWLV